MPPHGEANACLPLFVPTIRFLQAARSSALDNNIAVPLAQLDLANMAAGAVNLLSYESRARQASALFAFRDVPIATDSDSRGRGIEVGCSMACDRAIRGWISSEHVTFNHRVVGPSAAYFLHNFLQSPELCPKLC